MRDHLVRGLLLVLLVGCGLWLTSRTEWVEVDTFKPAKGEAAKNPLYATQQLARRLGAEVTQATSLAVLPPAGATLLLTSWDWDLFPERAQQLQRWVEQGGHLVLYAAELRDSEALEAWLPVERVDLKPASRKGPAPAEDEAPADDEAPPPPQRVAAPPKEPPCQALTELEGPSSSRPEGQRGFEVCGVDLPYSLTTRARPLWSLDGPAGPAMLRVAIGTGSATVVGPWGFFDSQSTLKGDHALVAVSVLQLRRGGALWFVGEESRPHLLRWLWSTAWIAIVLGLGALALWVWRGGVRFGPLAGPLPAGRRSMVEQITGTARFLRRQDTPTLHQAQVRALDRVAVAHLRGYGRMDRLSRADALSRATGLDARALRSALDPASVARRGADPAPVLELLETARRLLVQAPRLLQAR